MAGAWLNSAVVREPDPELRAQMKDGKEEFSGMQIGATAGHGRSRGTVLPSDERSNEMAGAEQGRSE
jgi:hypothetical protein